MRLSLAVVRRTLWSTGAALFCLLLLSLARIDHVPAAVAGGLFGLAALAAFRPALGFATIAAVIPVATWIGRTWDGSLAWPEAVAAAFLLGYCARQTFQNPGRGADALTLAIHMTIAIVAASLTVQLLVLHGTIGGEGFRGVLRELAGGAYFVGNSGLEGLDAAMRLIEGLLLAHAGASVVRINAPVVRRVIAAVVIGAAAAAALNLWRVWLGALRTDSPGLTFLRLMGTLRFNTHYGDVNAAGSYFVMTLPPVLALTRAVSTWRWILPTFLIAVSLVLSGSRAAILAGVVSAMTIWLLGYRRENRQRFSAAIRPALVIAFVLATVCAGGLYLAMQRNLTPAATAFRVRAEFVRISLDMLATRPIFGIGTGQYPARLSEFATPGLMAVYPVPRENAHNNFLQILAELGLAGFVAFMCVLGTAGARVVALLRKGIFTTVERGACAGLLAFVVTWLAGHPLLIDEPAFVFWLLMGTIAGSPGATAESAHARQGQIAGARASLLATRGRWLAAGLAVAVVASVPVRAQRELDNANLEHIGVGVSADWRHDGDVIYRTADERFALFLPTSRAVVVPMRLASASGAPAIVDLFLSGRLIDRVEISSTEWRRVRIVLPQTSRRFERVEFVVDTHRSATDDAVVRVGKAIELGPTF